MATARRHDAWDRTATVLCLLANINRNPEKQPRAFMPDDFHPFAQWHEAKPERMPGAIEDFKVFVKKR